MTPPTRVAIVGGGCAGLTAAFELTRPEQRGRFEVTVYQPGWRLGGKGASSRGACDRIEEHGIHLWMGCYENAFRMMRGVYEEIAPQRRNCPIRHWRDAFSPVTHIGLGRYASRRGWDVWSAYFPPTPGLPGDPLDVPGAEDPFSVAGYLTRALATLGLLVEHAFAAPPRMAATVVHTEADQRAWTQGDLLARAERVVAGGLAALRSPAQVMDGLRLLSALVGGPVPAAHRAILDLLDVAIRGVFDLFADDDDDARDAMSVADVIELVGVSMRGCIVDGVVGSPRGFDVLDAWDYRDWLVHHGASTRCLESPFVRGMYSLMFAYEHGDTTRPRLSAGVFLRVCARMFFTYRGALFWRMAAGMGEIVFAPIYECLRARGVRFEFFHRLDRVRLAAPGPGTSASRVAALEFTVQAEIRGGGAYEPLVDVHGLPCWPAEPLWDQLAHAPSTGPSPEYEAIWCAESRGARRLEADRDFDLVVVALGLGAVPHTCAELVDRHPRWRTMVQRVQTVATQAAQLWLEPSLPELGWRLGPIMMTGFAPPFDSWGDMSNLVGWESWPAERTPGSLSYFCNVLPDGGPAAQWATAEHATRMAARVRDDVEALLDDELPRLWPGAVGIDGRFDRGLLVAPPSGPAGVDGQYLRANTNPSDRYVLSVPGSGAARISPLDRDCENLTVAGDWTACGVDVGCIEAAVMSGMLAAHALGGDLPRTDDIVGYHHP